MEIVTIRKTVTTTTKKTCIIKEILNFRYRIFSKVFQHAIFLKMMHETLL